MTKKQDYTHWYQDPAVWLVAAVVVTIGLVSLYNRPSVTYTAPKTEASDTKVEKTEFNAVTLSGNGTKVTEPVELTTGGYKATMSYTGSANFIVNLVDKEGQVADNLANKIGSSNLSKTFRINQDGSYLFSVETGLSAGDWTIKIEAL